MRKLYFAAAGLVWVLGLASAAFGQEKWVNINGQTFREHRQVVEVPMVVDAVEERQRTVYREQYTTELRQTPRTVYVPVTEYVMQPRWHGLWNPFRQPHVAYHMVPQTRWEVRHESVQVPVTTRELVPETRTVQVPVRQLAIARGEVVAQVPVTGVRPSLAAEDRTQVAQRVGGIEKMENDPPQERRIVIPSDSIRR